MKIRLLYLENKINQCLELNKINVYNTTELNNTELLEVHKYKIPDNFCAVISKGNIEETEKL